MRREAKRAHPNETDGMLLGWSNPDENLVAVATVVGPGPTATHLPTRFVPDGTWQQTHLEHVYSATGGQVTFVGDWHSHPSGGFGMSRQDRQTMRQTAAHPRPASDIRSWGCSPAHPTVTIASACGDGVVRACHSRTAGPTPSKSGLGFRPPTNVSGTTRPRTAGRNGVEAGTGRLGVPATGYHARRRYGAAGDSVLGVPVGAYLSVYPIPPGRRARWWT